MKLSYASAAVLLAALGLAGCGKKETADSVATVNGDAISSKEFLDYVGRKSTVLVSTQQGVQQLRPHQPSECRRFRT